MNEDLYTMAAKILFECDNMANSVKSLREQLDAAQAQGATGVMRDLERCNRSVIRDGFQKLETAITTFTGALK